MRKRRERENPCEVCGHYHYYEEGEVCGVCGHHKPAVAGMENPSSSSHQSSFPSEILPEFLYLGTYHNAVSTGLLQLQAISHLLNTVQVTHNSSYTSPSTYHCLPNTGDQKFQFEDAIRFLEQCERENSRVLVYCMSGKSTSPAIVIAYLMKSKGWRFTQSYQWVKERRPCVNLTESVYQQLLEFEMKTFESIEQINSQIYGTTDYGIKVEFQLF